MFRAILKMSNYFVFEYFENNFCNNLMNYMSIRLNDILTKITNYEKQTAAASLFSDHNC